MEKKVQLNEEIISQIYFIQGRKVMLDSDLARIYRVTTARLNQQVRRNLDRFPSDFMFELSFGEYRNLMLQIATSSSKTIDNAGDSDLMPPIVTSDWGGRRKLSLVFQALRELVRQKEEPRTPVGFKIGKQTDH